jgi:uncharacterized protein with ParB-like and HNH nuclease domain
MSINTYKEIIDSVSSGGSTYYKINPKSINEFLNESKYLKIPDYQRPYSWSTTNITQLLKDIHNSIKDSKGWFLGPVFTTHNEDGIFNEKEILDGQQRLTTILLILREAYVLVYSYKEPLDLDDQFKAPLSLLQDRLQQCIISTEPSGYKGKFKSDIAIRLMLEDYFVSSKKIQSHENWVKDQLVFIEKLNNEDLGWSTTVRTVKDAVVLIREELVKIIGSNDQFDEKKFMNYIDFTNKLLDEFWLIEIPLKRMNFVLDIFESINNRGKPLTLVDIVRFKTLTLCNPNSVDKVQKDWQEIFKSLEKLTELDAIKDEEDFFKVVLNTYSRKSNGITQKPLFIKEFEDRFASPDGVDLFLSDVKNICEFLNGIYTPVDSANKLISVTSRQKKHKGIANLQLLRLSLKCSDNARYMVCYVARKLEINQDNIELIMKYLYDVTRAVIYYDIYTGSKSNEVRTNFIDVIQKIEDEESSIKFDNFLKEKDWAEMDDPTFDYNLLHTLNSDYANLLLSFYQFHKSPEIFVNGSAQQYKEFENEHMLPIKWMEHNHSKEYTLGQIEAIQSDLLGRKKEFVNFDVELMNGRLKTLSSKILLRKYDRDDKKRHTQENTLIQFIGNKWIITGPTNSSLGNDSFVKKKNKASEFIGSNRLFIPNDTDELGLSHYTDWDCVSIMNRSFKLVDKIKGDFKKDWN